MVHFTSTVRNRFFAPHSWEQCLEKCRDDRLIDKIIKPGDRLVGVSLPGVATRHREIL